ncbi:hypothetical protein FOZ63_003259 [Perkinsus olseni]|uniref:Succinate dehydrogenase assembly factor 4, mitochondrial n=1 Tax=Perkinsus olseni TaxID=32597 RepID=A0A7J6S9S3_PEROL|nr:hypothetical protein FOZ63_003259 [Perkinsus olseni]
MLRYVRPESIRLLAIPRWRIFGVPALRRFSSSTESQTASMNVSKAQQQAEESQMEVLFPVDSEYRAVARHEAAKVAKEDPISSSDSSTDDDSDIDEAEQSSYYKSDEGAPLWGALEGECGFKYEGPEPTRHGDWQYKGRCTDF